ncbi:MAG: GAF domain-containing protein [Christensenellales bacterium]
MEELLLRQLRELTEGERHPLPNLANAAALLWLSLGDINWAGFYLPCPGGLLLGPFQGKPACIRIAGGKGVCGAALARGETLRVEDVHAFPGHIACDPASRSEIVIPLRSGGRVVALLDIDSPLPGRFTPEDIPRLEAFASLLAAACDWEKLKITE